MQVGKFGEKIPAALRTIVQALAKQGFNIIVDDVSMEKNSGQAWKDTLKEFNVLWVGLTAPLEVIEKRERERGDRKIGQGRAAAGIVHQGHTYDLFLDTSRVSLKELVKTIKEKCSKPKQTDSNQIIIN